MITNMNENNTFTTSKMPGWVCPVCGRGLSPFTPVCPCKNDNNKYGWIPVTEHLPNVQEEVIVSCLDDSGDTKYRYTASGWVTPTGKYWVVDNEINPFVVAWMDKPKPWDGK